MKPIQRDSSAARSAVSLLAVTFVIICGLVACSTIVLTSSDQVLIPLGICLFVFSLIGWMCYRFVVATDRPVSERMLSSLWIYRSQKAKVTYELKDASHHSGIHRAEAASHCRSFAGRERDVCPLGAGESWSQCQSGDFARGSTTSQAKKVRE